MISSCTNSSSVMGVLQPFMDKNNITNGAILVVPNAGCSGCISSTEDFIIKNQHRFGDLYVVFTNIQSLKILNARIGEAILSHKNVKLDEDNNYYKEELLSIYPHIIYVKDSNFIDIVEVSPENTEALSNLQIELESK